jgi:ABC-type multidrug transport system permease subunit
MGAVRFLVLTAVKDVRRHLADWPALALWLGIPVGLGVVMGLAFGRTGAPPQAHVLLADEDASLLGWVLANAGSSQAGATPFRIERVASAADGRRRLEAGEASALLVLPRGFTDAVLEDRPATLALVTNPAQRILPEIARTGAELLVDALFYLQHLFGDELRTFIAARPPGAHAFADRDVAALAAGINRIVRQLEPLAIPPVLSLEAERPGTATPDFAALFVPSLLFMSLLFISRGFSDDLWTERRFGTLRRALALPYHPALFLGGKLLAAAAFLAVASAAGLVVAVVASGVPPARVPAALLWCTASGVVFVCLFLVLQFAASTARGADIVTSMVLFPLMMVGGSFFPFETMPAWMAAVGRLTPNGQGVTQLRALLAGQADGTALLVAALAMGLPAGAAFLLSARLLGRRFLTGA